MSGNSKKSRSKIKMKKRRAEAKNSRENEEGLAESSHVKKTKEKFSLDQLLEKAEELVDSFQHELAEKFCERAISLDPESLKALEMYGVLLLEMQQMEKAKECFCKAIDLAPSVGYSKYMYMGQLTTADEAIKYFQKGVEIMKKEFKSQQKSKVASFVEDVVSATDISSAYCSIAEIYLTDQCFEDNAEEKCKESLDAALQMDAENPEALQLLASYWMSKDDKPKAKESIEKAVSQWLPSMKEADKSEGAGVDPVQTCEVGYPARVNACKILVEVENYDMASEVLELLLDEEDEVVEVWYLLGWLNFLRGEDYYANSRFYLNKGKEVAVKTKFDDVEMLKHMDELIGELGPVPEEDMEDVDIGEIESDDEEDGCDGNAQEAMEH